MFDGIDKVLMGETKFLMVLKFFSGGCKVFERGAMFGGGAARFKT